MLASFIWNIYIDVECVANEYLARLRKGAWRKDSDKDYLKYWNLECLIEAETFGVGYYQSMTLWYSG